MIAKFLVIVPTRGRPGNVRRLIAGLAETGTSVADFLFVVDDDDPETPEYLRLADVTEGHRFAVIHRMRLGGTLNFISAQHTSEYGAIGFMGDDHLPRTRGWDKEVLDALNQPGPRVVYGNDLLQGETLPTAVFMSSRIIRALGYMCPKGQLHLYHDNFWLELGRSLGGLVYLHDTVIEHIHPAAGKAEMDNGYLEANAPAVDRVDREAWLKYRGDLGPDGFTTAVDRVRGSYHA